jgi:hypothetical protein
VTDLATIDSATDGRLGIHDIACVFCGPQRRSGTNQHRKVLRVWRIDPHFATYHCARCCESGYVRDSDAVRPDPVALERARTEAADREANSKAKRIATAQRLWSKRRPISEGMPPWLYLRRERKYTGPIPATLAFLPPFRDFPAAMIAAFGVACEPEPGIIVPPKVVRGVHLTRLTTEGEKLPNADGKAKLMRGVCQGAPITISAPNDLLGMAVTEGIEDGVSIYQSTGLGVWAAGSGGFMPALAPLIPHFIETITIYAHDDDTGRSGAINLARALKTRGFDDVLMQGL